MSEVDPRDFGTIMAERDRVKEELDQSRDRFRAADKQAQKVPALESEVNRLRKVEENLRSDLNDSAEEQGNLQKQIDSLKADLRPQEQVSKEAEQAQADRADALAEKEDAENALGEAQSRINELESDLEKAEKEIERLRPISEAADRLKDALEALKTV